MLSVLNQPQKFAGGGYKEVFGKFLFDAKSARRGNNKDSFVMTLDDSIVTGNRSEKTLTKLSTGASTQPEYPAA